jgi:hypothetical protein
MKRLVIPVGLAVLLSGVLLYSSVHTDRTRLEESGAGFGSPEPPLGGSTLQALRERAAYQAGPTTENQGSSLLGIAAGGGNVRPPEASRGWAQGTAPPGGNTPSYP